MNAVLGTRPTWPACRPPHPAVAPLRPRPATPRKRASSMKTSWACRCTTSSRATMCPAPASTALHPFLLSPAGPVHRLLRPGRRREGRASPNTPVGQPHCVPREHRAGAGEHQAPPGSARRGSAGRDGPPHLQEHLFLRPQRHPPGAVGPAGQRRANGKKTAPWPTPGEWSPARSSGARNAPKAKVDAPSSPTVRASVTPDPSPTVHNGCRDGVQPRQTVLLLRGFWAFEPVPRCRALLAIGRDGRIHARTVSHCNPTDGDCPLKKALRGQRATPHCQTHEHAPTTTRPRKPVQVV